MARFQVVESGTGWAVQDTKDDTVWTKTYDRFGNAVNKAVKLNESFGNSQIWDDATKTYRF
jgi:hypothetical protein